MERYRRRSTPSRFQPPTFELSTRSGSWILRTGWRRAAVPLARLLIAGEFDRSSACLSQDKTGRIEADRPTRATGRSIHEYFDLIR
jgi:hypothetical protein